MNTPINSQHRHCPACNAPSGHHTGQKAGFDILACRACRTLYIPHLPVTEEAQDYDAYYSPANLTTPDFVDQRLDEIAVSFLPHRENNRLLDVGFGAGDLLQASARAGWDAEGIEVSQPAVAHAQSLGLKVFHGDLMEAHYPDDQFDVVTAVEVLEHVPDPLALVQEIARILRPGGLFWATTPHGRGLSARLLKMHWSVVAPPEHLQLLSVKGAKTLLTHAGFRKTQVATQGVNPYELLHRLRRRTTNHIVRNSDNFSRNTSGYELNEYLTASPSRRALKNAANGILTATRLGDSLKIRAVL